MIFFSHTSVKYVKDQYIKLVVFQIELKNGKVFFNKKLYFLKSNITIINYIKLQLLSFFN